LIYEIEGFPGPRSGSAWMASELEIWLGNFESTLREIAVVVGGCPKSKFGQPLSRLKKV